MIVNAGGKSFFRMHVWVVVLALTLPISGYAHASDGAGAGEFDPSLLVYFFDVGQGDATLFLGKDFTILIDAGRHDRDDVVPQLETAGVRSIDLMIVTHPHSDHIGQCPDVLERFPVKEVWLSGDVHTTRSFERCIDAILASDAGYYEPRAGEVFRFGSAVVEVIHPEAVTGDFNNGSIGVKISYGDIAFLLTGDAETDAEAEMIAGGRDLQAEILQVGHHGSSTSSSAAFLMAVRPELAVYSAGKDNPYGHPHKETLRRFAELGIKVYGTDVHGTIRVVTDGERYRVETSKAGAVALVHASGSVTDPSGCAPGQINVNTATKSQLEAIKHVGPALAERIIAGRPFLTIKDLIRVDGIGEGRLRDIQEQGLACALIDTIGQAP